MISIVVGLSAAMLCYSHQCIPVLVGIDTPIGSYPIIHATTAEAGYGGDVLAFARKGKKTYAVHRVWTLVAKEHRVRRLELSVDQRRSITHGCINLRPADYDALVSACNSEGCTLNVTP